MKVNIFKIIYTVIVVSILHSCNHDTACKIPLPTFDTSKFNVRTSGISQSIYAVKYDKLATYTWHLKSTPTSTVTAFLSTSNNPALTYSFNKEGLYTFSLISDKFGCYSDTAYLNINSSLQNSGGGGGGGGSSPCSLPTGKNFKLENTYYTSTNVPSLSATSNYDYIGLYDNASNNVYFYLPKTFKANPTLGDYTINSSKTYSQLTGTECAIEIKGTRYAAVNPSTAVVHIKSGTSKFIELSVCNFQYLYMGYTYTLEAKFEFNP